MVSFSQLTSKEDFLYSKEPLPSLIELCNLVDYQPQGITERILNKEFKTASEKRHISWLKHSLAFKAKQFSPKTILTSWTNEVEEILEEAWDKSFDDSEKIALAYMGKLGSRELNLSSDIDLIFFGENGHKLKIRSFIEEISGPTEIPTGFKLDFDLRPGGRDAPLISTTTNLGHYIWNNSDPWERYSYTRLRAELGQCEVKNEIKKIADSFCYRKHLSSDFFHSFLKLRETYRETLDEDKYHLKLGEGGIRDIELFVQTFQILYGGKLREYRGKSTFELIDLFIEKNIHRDFFSEIKTSYYVIRHAEGLLHALNEKGGFYWDDKLDEDFNMLLDEATAKVSEIIKEYSESSQNLFGKTVSKSPRQRFLKELKEKTENRQVDSKVPLEMFDLFFSEKNKRFSPYLNAILSQENVKESFIDLLCYSRFGCQVLSRRPSLLDIFILRRYKVGDLEGIDKLNALADMKMVEQIISINEFAKTGDLEKLGARLTRSYEFIVDNLSRDGQDIDYFFLGKMATRELGLNSDLDFVLVYDNLSIDRGEKIKEARKIFKNLSHSTIFGPLVPFDKNAGPMGNATPLVMSTEGLKAYLDERAEPWQKLMYLKHRRLYKQEYLEFLKKPASSDEMDELFKILKLRLHSRDLGGDPTKLEYGGIFHTEFIIGCLWLDLGVQPKSTNSMTENIESLATHHPSKKSDLKVVEENYRSLRSSRQNLFIQSEETFGEDVFKLLRFNCKILETLSKEILKRSVFT